MQLHKTIHKTNPPILSPNLSEYEDIRSNFEWSSIEKELDWLPNGGLNIAYEAIDRHCLK